LSKFFEKVNRHVSESATVSLIKRIEKKRKEKISWTKCLSHLIQDCSPSVWSMRI